jgi:hypothetical protein
MLTTLRRPVVLVPLVLLGIAVITAAMLAFQPWRLFTNVTVDEALPSVSAPASPNADAVQSEPTTLATGEFISHEHETAGTVRILELADGSRVLRIEDLDTDNGPDLKVWLTDAPVIDGPSGWFVFDDGDYADLGSLKGNKGSQNYAIPADVDLADLTSLTIWCDRFNVSFGAAELIGA